ncbi:MAG TPA: hypothetical protein VMU05_21550 [Dongiaceae bacterium]|nr:hypothetical protein [Dongiaceae bacterium]
MRSLQSAMLLSMFLVFPCLTSGQVGTQFRTLVVNDHAGKVAVLRIENRTYIDLKRLVQIAHGSITYQGNQIVVTLPGGTENAPLQTADADNSALTKDFVKTGIEVISLMREWASSLANAIQNGYPVSEHWVASYAARTHTGVALASAAASSEGDRKAFQLLSSEFDAVQAWSNKLLDAQKSMTAGKYAVSDNALQDDPQSHKIVTCGQFLDRMLAGGTFQDDPSCH